MSCIYKAYVSSVHMSFILPHIVWGNFATLYCAGSQTVQCLGTAGGRSAFKQPVLDSEYY
jgi:hypothetical protein